MGNSGLKSRFQRECGADRFFLDPGDIAAIGEHLHRLGWNAEDRVVSAARIGDGNMNLTVRVRVGSRSVILKQSRPWVEKYPSIPAPANRATVEAAFYRAVVAEPAVSGRMPALLGSDGESNLILLEDLTDASDMMPVYSGARLSAQDVDELLEYLNALHALEVDPALRPVFENREMRALNHAHQYVIPLEREFINDTPYRSAIEALGRRYLADGGTLVHGDFFPGSWLKNEVGMFIIDPEFCFLGCAEYDLGILHAHLIFSGHEAFVARVRERYARPADWRLAARFAGVELMRRLIGVAQLPLRAGAEQKREWLELSRELVCG